MAILIEGMEMPKKGSWVSLRVFPDGQCFLYSWCGNDFDFMEHLTAVPVPPHGRLIDADALKEAFCGNCFADENPMECSEPCMDMRIILEAPTVIPASEEGE